MARMNKPWRALALASVFALAACEPAIDVAAPVTSGVAAESLTSAQVDLQDQSPVSAVVTNGIESLVMMGSSTSDDGLVGAGCAVDGDEPLADGDWFGFVLDSTHYRLVVDIACVYGPDTDQFQAYSADEASPWSSYVVVNDVVEAQEVRFGPNSQAYMADDNWQARPVRDVIEDSRANPQEAPRAVWLRIENGRVGAVVEPYSMGVAAD